MNDDLTLLREFAASNSEAAFAALVSRHVNLVYSVALRSVRDPHLAEEITQAVFIILARKADKLSPQTVLAGWLCRTARHVGSEALRTQNRRRQREQEAYMQTQLQSDLPCRSEAEAETWTHIAPLLDGAMETLGRKDHDALVLRFFEGKNFAEVGAALGMGEDTARVRVNRALEKLRKFFTKRGVSSTTAIIAGTISANSVSAAPAALAKTVTAAAVVKGTAASASTLTLIKGALKIMAWTKTKTAILIGATAVLGIGAVTIVIEAIPAIHEAHLNALHNIQGAWEGVMPLGQGITKGGSSMTRIVLKLSKSNGVYHATADMIDMGRKDVPVDGVIYKYPTLEIVLSPRTTYHGIVNAPATQITFERSVLLQRITTPDTTPVPLAADDFMPQPDSPLQGYWTGTLDTKPDSLPLDLKIAGQADGTFRAELDNPMQGANAQPASVIYDPPGVKLILLTGSGMFQGELNNANTELAGSWVQGGKATPFVLKRADYQAELASEPVKDYAYASQDDLPGHWKGSWILPIGQLKISIRYDLDIARLPDGSYAATLANLDQLGNSDSIPASDIQYTPPALHLSWKSADNMQYDGKLENGKLVGTWLEGGGGFPLVFERNKQPD